MINNTDIKVSFRGNGSTKVFPFTFPFISKDYIHVAIYDSVTEKTTTLTSDYYVDANAHTVTYPGYAPGQAPAAALQPPVLPSTKTITIYRSTDINQLVDLGDKYPLPDIESMSDKLTEILQEHKEALDRSIKVQIGDPETPEEKYLDMQTYVAETKASATAAAASANAAAGSASSALMQANNAANSATAAANSAAAALSGQNAAAASANAAETSKNAAANSAALAASSQSAAAASAANAANSQNAAANSATAALTSENAARNSASSADISRAAAEIAATTATSQAASVGTLATNAENILAGYAAYTVSAWDASTVYSYPTVVAYNDGYTYRCIGTNVPAGTVPNTSSQWVKIVTRGGDDFFDIDVWGGLMPAENPTAAFSWTLDENGSIMPKDASDNLGREPKTDAELAYEAALEALANANSALAAIPMELDDDGAVTPTEEDEEEP